MRIGLALPQYDYDGASWADIVAVAVNAERLGLDSVWFADHLFMGIEKYGAPPPGLFFGYDPIVGLGHLARTTKHITLGALVLCAQLRPPKLLARQLTTVAALAGSRDRIVPGVGAGWHEPEYVAAGIPFERPARRLEQMVETLEIVGQAGFTKLAGGRGDRFLGHVARHADGWNTAWSIPADDYAERAAFLDRACEEIGRDPATVERTLGLFTLIGEDERDLVRRFERLQAATLPGVVDGMTLEEWRHGRLVGTVEQVREQVAQWGELGVSLLIAGLGALPFSISDPDDLDLLASALL